MQLDQWQKSVLEAKGNICVCSGRQTGKSTIIAIREGEYAVNNAKKSVLIISATERQAEELFNKVLNYLMGKYSKYVKRGKFRPTKHIINLKNGSIIRCLPTGLAGIGIRGFTIDRLVADEAAFIPEDVWTAVTPMLLTTGGDIVLLSTPHGRLGYFYQAYHDKNFKVFHVNSEEIIANREISESWTLMQREKAKEHLEREKMKMSQMQYAQEYLGQFIDDLRQLFNDELIKKVMCLKRGGLTIYPSLFLGVDIARMGEDESTFEILGRNGNKLTQVESIITTKTLTTDTARRILNLDKQYNFKKIYIDDGGLGVAVFDQLLLEDSTKRKIVAINNSARALDKEDKKRKKLLKEDLYMNLLRLMERGDIKLLDDDEIYQSLKSVQYEYLIKEGQLTRMRIFGNYTHIAEGLIRAAWCVRDKSLNLWVRY